MDGLFFLFDINPLRYRLKICLKVLKDFNDLKDFKTNSATDSVLYAFCIGGKTY